MFYKKAVPKDFTVFTGKHLSYQNCKPEALAQGFPCEFFKFFKNSFFSEHLWMNVSALKQLLALQFAIIYCWQLSSRPSARSITLRWQNFFKKWQLQGRLKQLNLEQDPGYQVHIIYYIIYYTYILYILYIIYHKSLKTHYTFYPFQQRY